MKNISKTVILLSLVSLFTDISSEMLYPVMPLFLTSIGFGALFIGILEGIAEATAGFSKGFFGRLSDSRQRRAPFIQAGYTLSAFSKPMMALILNPLWILLSRTLDRTGKGLRTGARDALISSESIKENKGRVFGFHRAADTLGAAIGPVLALIYLHFYPENYRELFFIAFIPAAIGLIFTFLIKDKKNERASIKTKTSFFSFLKYWKKSDANYRKLVGGLLAFALVNSSDAFLLLFAMHKGLSDSQVIAAYIFYNLVYAVSSYPAGMAADRIGLKKVFIVGLYLFSFTYFGMVIAQGTEAIYAMFFIYGIYAASTEGVSKAWLTNIAAKEDAATAIGFYTGWQSIFALSASVLAGALWAIAGAEVTFVFSSVAALFVCLFLAVKVK